MASSTWCRHFAVLSGASPSTLLEWKNAIQIFAPEVNTYQIRDSIPGNQWPIFIYDKNKAKLSKHGCKPWSSGYRRTLMLWRLWFLISAQYTGWTFFTYISCKKIVLFVWKDKNKQNRGRRWPNFQKTVKVWLAYSKETYHLVDDILINLLGNLGTQLSIWLSLFLLHLRVHF